jgi:hypothetical protein
MSRFKASSAVATDASCGSLTVVPSGTPRFSSVTNSELSRREIAGTSCGLTVETLALATFRLLPALSARNDTLRAVPTSTAPTSSARPFSAAPPPT